MKPDPRFLLSSWCKPVVCALLMCAGATRAQTSGAPVVSGKTIYYPDNTRVDSVMDRIKKETTEITYDSREVMLSKKVYLLNDQGMPTQGVIYDGAGNFTARTQFFYDDLGRMIEQRLFNTQGEIFQRTIFQYNESGQPLPPAVYKMKNVAAPSMKPATVDFTGTKKAAAQQAPKAQVVQPGQKPKILSVSPRTGETTEAQQREADEKNRNAAGAAKR